MLDGLIIKLIGKTVTPASGVLPDLQEAWEGFTYFSFGFAASCSTAVVFKDSAKYRVLKVLL